MVARSDIKETNLNLTGADALANLLQAQIGSPITSQDVEFHDSPKIVLPNGMTYERAFEVLKRLQKDAETPTSFDRKFLYRADDGAYAAYRVIKEHYGMGLGATIETFFGTIPSETRTIAIGPGQTMQIPWGKIEIPVFKGLEVYLMETRDRDYGKVFSIHAEGPRKWKDDVEAFFDRVEFYLRTNSIYRGRALIGADELEFMDLESFDRGKIVFADDVEHILDGTLFAPIKHAETMRREGVPLKRAVLLYGPYGTGKTSTGQITAQVAVENGWTFVSARPGRDKVDDVLRLARLYQPAVVFVEDIDGEASTGENEEVTRLLEAFDGITAKGGELMVVMTTNHIERIHKGMLRPGRLDAVVEIASLDRHGVERLIKAVVKPGKLAADVDYDAVFKAMDGFFPAFVRESINRAVTFAIGRLEGQSSYVIDTDDLVGAALSLRPQLDQLHDANEGQRKPALSAALEATVQSAVTRLMFEGGHVGRIEARVLTDEERDAQAQRDSEQGIVRS